MEEKRKAGSIIALIGALYGIFGSLIVFNIHWQEAYFAKKAQELAAGEGVGVCADIIKWMYPALTDIAVIGSVILLIAAYLYWKNHENAWAVAMAGILLMVQGTGFPIVAAASAGLFPKYVLLFVPNLVLFYLFMTYVRKLDSKVVIFATIVGMVYVLCLFNGVASASRSLSHGGVEGTAAQFVAVQRLNWVAVVGWFIFLYGTLLKKKWVYPIFIGAATLGIVGGVQLGLDSMINEGTIFSMFLMAPIFSIGLLIYLLSSKGQKLFYDWINT